MKDKRIFEMVLFSSFTAIILIMALVPFLGYITFIPGFASLTIIHIPVIIGMMVLSFKYAMGLFTVFGLSSLMIAWIRPGGPVDYAFQNPLISVVPRILAGLLAYLVFLGLKKLITVPKYGKSLTFFTVSLIAILFMYFAGRGLSIQLGWNMDIIAPIMLVLASILVGLYYYLIEKNQASDTLFVPATFITTSLVHSLVVLVFLATVTVALPHPEIEGQMIWSTVPDYFGIAGSVIIYGSLGTSSLIEALLAVVIGSPIALAIRNYMKRDLV